MEAPESRSRREPMTEVMARRLWASGLPAAVPHRERVRRLAERCAPAWSFVAVLVFGQMLLLRGFTQQELDALLYAPDQGIDVDTLALALLALGLAAVIVPLCLWGLLKVLPGRVGMAAGLLTLAVTVLSPTLASLATVDGPGAGEFRDRVSVLPALAIAVFVYLGWGRLLAWTLARAMREAAGSLVRSVRALPLLLVAFLFFFYNAELWQLGVAWTVQRSILVAGILWSFGVLASFIVVNEYVREAIEGDAKLPLRLRLNLRWVAASVQAAQASFFGVLVFFGFIFLGWVSIPEATIAAWTSKPPVLVEIGPVSFPGALVKVSWVLGGFASLYMITATAADAREREDQLGPVTREVRAVLGAAGIVGGDDDRGAIRG